MRGYCRVTIVGTLGRDPQAKVFPDGGEASNFTLATTDTWTDKATGERKEQTEWHRITAIGRLAEVCNKNLKKGTKVVVEGTLKTRSWFDKEINSERYITEVRIDRMEILSPFPQNQDQNPQDQDYSNNQNGYSDHNQGYNNNQNYQNNDSRYPQNYNNQQGRDFNKQRNSNNQSYNNQHNQNQRSNQGYNNAQNNSYNRNSNQNGNSSDNRGFESNHHNNNFNRNKR